MPIWRGTTSTDWGTASNWVVDGLGNSGVPTTTTDAIFDATSTNPCTTGAVARNCRDLITTGFTNVLTIGSTSAGNINVNRNATFGTDATHLDAASLANINMAVTGNTITSASSSVIVPGITNVLSGTVNLIGTISVKRFAPLNGTYNSATAGTFIELVNGGTWSGSGGPGTNVTLRINGSCSNNVVTTRGTIVLATGSTLTMNGEIDFNGVVGSINFSAGTLIPNTQLFRVQNTSNVTINLGTNSFYNATLNSTIILASAMNITNNLTFLTANLTGAFDITVNGNLTGGSVTQNSPGRKIKVTGITTGTCTITNFSFIGSNLANTYKLEIDCNANNFVMTGLSTTNNATIDYLATNTGTFTATGSSLNFQGGALNISMVGRGDTYVWGTIQNTGGLGQILTLLSDVYVNAIGTISNATSINGIGFTLNVFGNVGTMAAISGTATLKFIGSSNATWTQTAATTNALAAIVFAKTGLATVNIPNNFTYTGTITYTSGAVNHTATLTLGSSTMNTSNLVPWNNITISAGATITINSLLLITNNLTLSGASTFAGTAGWDCGNLIHSIAGTFNIILRQLITYRTRSSVNITGGLATAARPTMISSDATNLAIWTLDPGATQTLIYVNGTRIDSSLGQTVWTFGGTISAATKNWNNGTRPGTSAYTFVN
jgi:hypothetical protein